MQPQSLAWRAGPMSDFLTDIARGIAEGFRQSFRDAWLALKLAPWIPLAALWLGLVLHD